MKKSTTKRAVFLSFVSMFLCFTMLLGTTYAWFTDNVTSGVNTIVAGNLDVELYNGLDETAPAVTENTVLFDGIELWEPGAAVYENFTVANKGNLALKYQFDVVIADAAGYDSFAEVLKVGVVDGGIADNTTREAAIAAVDEWMSFETFSEVGTLAVNGSDTYGVVIYWEPSDRDNEFNMNNENSEKELKVTIGVNLFATQMEAESDSFGSDYDSDAVYADHYASNAAELVAAIAEGGSVALMEDIVLSDMARAAASNFGFVIAKNNDVVINLNGNNIIKTNANSDINGDGKFTSADNQGVFQVKGNLTVVGNGTVSMENAGDDMSWNALSAVFSVEGGTLTLGEGVTVVHNGGTSMSYAVDVNSTGAATTLNVDGAILSSTYTGVRVFNNSKTAKATVNVISGTIDGAKRDIWVHNPSANAVDANAIVNIAESYGEVQLTVQDTSYNSRIYDFDAVVAIAKDATALKAAANNASAGDIIIADGVVVEGKNGLNLNGATLVGATFTNEGGEAISGTINGTFKDCTFEGNETLRWCYTSAGNDVVFENCVIKTTKRGVHFDVMNGNVTFKNCEINGFNAYSGSGTMTFEGCTFGCDESNYNGLNIYSNTVLKDCTFNFVSGKTNFIDMEGTGKTLTIINCTATLDGVAADVADFVGGSKLAENTVVYQ